MAFDPSYITAMFSGIAFNESRIILPLILIGLSIVMITRDVDQMKVLFLPVTIMWFIAGLHVSLVIILVAAMIFVFTTVGVQIIGRTAKSISIASDYITKNRYSQGSSGIERTIKGQQIGLGKKTYKREAKKAVKQWRALRGTGMSAEEAYKITLQKNKKSNEQKRFWQQQGKIKLKHAKAVGQVHENQQLSSLLGSQINDLRKRYGYLQNQIKNDDLFGTFTSWQQKQGIMKEQRDLTEEIATLAQKIRKLKNK